MYRKLIIDEIVKTVVKHCMDELFSLCYKKTLSCSKNILKKIQTGGSFIFKLCWNVKHILIILSLAILLAPFIVYQGDKQFLSQLSPKALEGQVPTKQTSPKNRTTTSERERQAKNGIVSGPSGSLPAAQSKELNKVKNVYEREIPSFNLTNAAFNQLLQYAVGQIQFFLAINNCNLSMKVHKQNLVLIGNNLNEHTIVEVEKLYEKILNKAIEESLKVTGNKNDFNIANEVADSPQSRNGIDDEKGMPRESMADDARPIESDEKNDMPLDRMEIAVRISYEYRMTLDNIKDDFFDLGPEEGTNNIFRKAQHNEVQQYEERHDLIPKMLHELYDCFEAPGISAIAKRRFRAKLMRRIDLTFTYEFLLPILPQSLQF